MHPLQMVLWAVIGADIRAGFRAKKNPIESPPSILNAEFASVRRERDEASSLLERERAATRRMRTEAAIADSEAVRMQGSMLTERM